MNVQIAPSATAGPSAGRRNGSAADGDRACREAKLGNSEVAGIVGGLIYDRLNTFFEENPKDIKLIIENLGLIADPESVNTLTDYLYAADRDLIIAAIQAPSGLKASDSEEAAEG